MSEESAIGYACIVNAALTANFNGIIILQAAEIPAAEESYGKKRDTD